MSLIVETGTARSDAESYISVADADAYFTSLGEATWAGLITAAKEQALRKATEYMMAVYRTRWQGMRYSWAQALDWPRAGVLRRDGFGGMYNYDQIPLEVQHACAKLALRASSAALAPDISRVTKQEIVGPLQVVYADGHVPYTRYREVDLLPRSFCCFPSPHAEPR